MSEKLRNLAQHLIREGYVDNEADAYLVALRLRIALDSLESPTRDTPARAEHSGGSDAAGSAPDDPARW